MDLLGLTLLGGAAALLAIDLHAQEKARLAAQAPAGPRPRPAVEHRCPYCHQVLADGTPRMRCGACATRHHASCWEEHGRCSVHGCASVVGKRLLPVGEPREPAAPAVAPPVVAIATTPPADSGDALVAAEPVGTPVEGVAVGA